MIIIIYHYYRRLGAPPTVPAIGVNTALRVVLSAQEELCLAISLLRVKVTPEELSADLGLIEDYDVAEFDEFAAWWHRHQALNWCYTMSYFVLFLVCVHATGRLS